MTLTESVASLQSAVDGACAELNRLRQSNSELLEALKGMVAAQKATKVTMAIPFCRWEDDKLKHGTITGVHSRTHNILVRFDGEKGTQQEYYWSADNGKYLKLTPALEQEYTELQQDLETVQKAVDAFEKQHSFNAAKVIKEKLETVPT